jgi:hypothetical protein
MPSTWPISWQITSLSEPSFSIAFRSAVSNCISPFAGRNAALPAFFGRSRVGPACPRMPPSPSMSVPSARMRRSSITSPSTSTLGRSPTITRHQRSAAFLKAFFCFVLRPPMNRTSIWKGEAEFASPIAMSLFAFAMYVSYLCGIFSPFNRSRRAGRRPALPA